MSLEPSQPKKRTEIILHVDTLQMVNRNLAEENVFAKCLTHLISYVYAKMSTTPKPLIALNPFLSILRFVSQYYCVSIVLICIHTTPFDKVAEIPHLWFVFICITDYVKFTSVCRKQVFKNVCAGSRASVRDCEWYSKSCQSFTELFISSTQAVVVADVPGEDGEPEGGVFLRTHRQVLYIIMTYHQTSSFSFFSILFFLPFQHFLCSYKSNPTVVMWLECTPLHLAHVSHTYHLKIEITVSPVSGLIALALTICQCWATTEKYLCNLFPAQWRSGSGHMAFES